MLFNSFSFALFFPVVTIGYFVLPQPARWMWLLAASCYFYAAFIPAYLLILLVLIVIDYLAGIAIEKAENPRRKAFLCVSLVANLGMLAFFKYFNFLNANVAALTRLLDWNYSVPALRFALPIGLSFHTFQAMSYTIEVYRGRQTPERHLGIFALYVMFYPSSLRVRSSGPIIYFPNSARGTVSMAAEQLGACPSNRKTDSFWGSRTIPGSSFVDPGAFYAVDC